MKLFNTADITAFVPLITVGVIAVLAVVAVFVIRSKMRQFSKNMFGTESLSEGINKEKQALSETPRSLHSMTSVYLPQIRKDFPEFDYALYKNKAESLLRSYLTAIDGKDVLKLSEECSLTLKNKVRSIISDLNSRNEAQFFREIVIHNTEIARYIKNGATVTILFEIAVGYYSYILDANENVVFGSKDIHTQTVYEVGLMYVQDESKVAHTGESLGVHCPNCGAPITNLGAKHCEYCGTGIIEVNTRAWKFSSVTEQTNSRKKF